MWKVGRIELSSWESPERHQAISHEVLGLSGLSYMYKGLGDINTRMCGDGSY